VRLIEGFVPCSAGNFLPEKPVGVNVICTKPESRPGGEKAVRERKKINVFGKNCVKPEEKGDFTRRRRDQIKRDQGPNWLGNKGAINLNRISGKGGDVGTRLLRGGGRD